jgi:hypothetical protein
MKQYFNKSLFIYLFPISYDQLLYDDLLQIILSDATTLHQFFQFLKVRVCASYLLYVGAYYNVFLVDVTTSHNVIYYLAQHP